MPNPKFEGVVEAHAAYSYDCEICGKENFLRAVEIDLLPEDKLAALQKIDILGPHHTVEDLPEGSFQCHPTRAVCQHCGANLKVLSPGQDEDQWEQEDRFEGGDV